ncbi:MAG: anthranilate synthase component II [Rhodothalassiaceae bacterium]
MFILIDNYDSFTFNLYHFLEELGAEVVVHRNDAIDVATVLAAGAEGLIISPGPGRPEDAGITQALIRAAMGRLPVLGVCLGHQAIAAVCGGRIVRAPRVMHGKVSAIRHDGSGVFADIPSPFTATRYHSLIVERASLPAALRVTAETEDGIIMGLAHRQYPLHGVQFHPESIASEHGHRLLANFIALARPRAAA